jgi:hypothetical protein
MEIAPIEDVNTEILTVLGESRAMVNLLKSKVSDLQESQLVNVDRLGQETLSALISGYSEQLKSLGTLLIATAKLDIAGRRQSLMEADYSDLGECIRRGVYSLVAGLSEDQAIRTLTAIQGEIARVWADR